MSTYAEQRHEQVARIKRQYLEGATVGELARAYHCSPKTISAIVHNRTWTGVRAAPPDDWVIGTA